MNKRFLVKVFTRFERFWHWSQAILIFTLLFSGFAIRGIFPWISFKTAVIVHTTAAFILLLLWLSVVFWHFTTGNWKHYIPTTNGLWRVTRFYAYGIFKHEEHPYRKRFLRKYNPLQALTYSAVKLILFPAIWITGLLYLSYPFWTLEMQAFLGWIAHAHVLAAFGVLTFFVLHIYILTTGHSLYHHVRPMLTGFDEIELSPAEETYFRESCNVVFKEIP
jgi:thiosulfate reductase cytochrome b subunit